MARVHYSEAIKRFTHIDAELVGFECSLPGECSYTVSLYPWWEHPRLKEMMARGGSWSVDAPNEAYREVTVYPKNVLELRLSKRGDVIDWQFTKEDPLLWQFEPTGDIMCNSALTPEQCIYAAGVASESLGFNRRENPVLQTIILDNVNRYGNQPPFSLGDMPLSAFRAFREQLLLMGVEFLDWSPTPVEVEEKPVLFLIDDGDYIIAEDFELEIPEFEHRDEWVSS